MNVRLLLSPGTRALMTLALCVGASVAHAQQVAIATPAPGTVVAPGQTLSVAVAVTGAVAAVQVAGQDLGVTSLQSTPPYTFNFTVPASAIGQKNLTAIGVVGSGQIVVSSPVTIDIEPSAQVMALVAAVHEIAFGFIGDQRSVQYIATFADGSHNDVTRSSQIQYSSGNPAVASADSTGTITAVASGATTVSASYGGQTAVTRILVPPYVKGDLDGDGRVTASDMLILQASVGAVPTSMSDARDLNGDGVIDSKDLQILATICGSACAAIGTAFNIASTPGSMTIAAGQTATYNITLEPQPGFSGNVSMSCSGLPAQATCTFSPASLTISQTPASVQLSIATVKTAADVQRGRNRREPAAPLFAALTLVPIGALAAARRRMRRVSLLLVGSLVVLSACGGGGTGSGSMGNPGTPANAYSIAVKATAGSVTESTSVILIVT